MRIREIRIDGFGRFHDLTLPAPARLGLFLGPNEAGKTTLMAFVRAILFGFEDRRSGRNRYEPFRGGVHGGALLLEDREGRRYRVERRAGRARGDVRVIMPDGRVEGEAAVANLLGGVSPVLYQNVFAFGLEELENLGTLKRDEVSGHIYSAGLGLGAASLVDVMRRLDGEMEQLFKRSGQNPEINRLLRELDRLDQEIAELRREPAEYNQLRERLRVLGGEIEAAREEARALEQRAAWLEKLDQAWEIRQRLVTVRARLQALPAVDTFPEAGVERLERLEERLRESERRRAALQAKVAEARARRERLPVNGALLQHRAEIRAVDDERAYVARLRQSLPARAAELKSRADALAAHLRSLGTGWDERAVGRFDVSVAAREAVRAHKAAVEAGEMQVREAEMRLERARRDRDRLRREAGEARQAWEACAVPEAPTAHPLEERRQALLRAEKGRAEVRRLEQELQHSRERRADLEAQIERVRRMALAAEQAPISGALPLIAAGAGLAIAVVLAFLGLPEWGVGVGAAGVGIAVALWLGRAFWLRSASERVRDLERDISTLERAGREVDERIRRLEEELGRVRAAVAGAERVLAGRELSGDEELAAVARALEEERAAHEEKRRLHTAYLEKQTAAERAQRDVEEAQGAFDAAREALEGRRNAWRAWLAERGLDGRLTPDGALEVLRAVEQAGEALRAKEAAAKELEAAQAAYDGFSRRVAALIERCGGGAAEPASAPSSDTGADEATSVLDAADVSSRADAVEVSTAPQSGSGGAALPLDDPLAAAGRLAEALRTSEENSKERSRLGGEIKELERELAEVEHEIEETRMKLGELLERGGAGDSETFRSREAVYRERKALDQERITLEGHLATLAKPDRTLAELESALERFDERSLRDERDAAAEASRKARAVYENKLQEQGRLRERLSQLEAGEALAQRRQEWETHRAALEDRARRWAVKALCRHFLELARERHERERQPAVLQRASGYFAIMTRGGFERVLSPLGERELYVERRGGERLPTGALSRGTAEQLYLAMRFALVREYAARSVALPIILDDVFVNFDPDRLRAALEVVRDVSEHHQTLMFTCHPHVAQAVREVIPESEPILVEEAASLGEAAAASEA